MKKNNSDNDVYYLKNANSNLYLNNNSNQILQSYFSNLDSKRWIFKHSSNNYYTIQSSTGKTKGLTVGTLIETGLYNVTNTSSTPQNITMVENEDGTITLTVIMGNNMYALGVLNNSTSNNAQVVWKAYSPYDKSQKWFRCTNCYKVGDSTVDGSINSNDVTNILSIAACIGTGTDNSSNLVRYLSDYNGDGIVNSADSTLLQIDLSHNYY